MIEYRCNNCKKLLFKGLFGGIIEIKCHHCKKVCSFKI